MTLPSSYYLGPRRPGRSTPIAAPSSIDTPRWLPMQDTNAGYEVSGGATTSHAGVRTIREVPTVWYRVDTNLSAKSLILGLQDERRKHFGVQPAWLTS